MMLTVFVDFYKAFEKVVWSSLLDMSYWNHNDLYEACNYSNVLSMSYPTMSKQSGLSLFSNYLLFLSLIVTVLGNIHTCKMLTYIAFDCQVRLPPNDFKFCYYDKDGNTIYYM